MAIEQQYDALAEAAVIATLFSTPAMLDELNDVLLPDDFYEERNKIIFETALVLHEQGRSYDPLNLAGELKRDGLLPSIGGINYITDLLAPNRLTQHSSDPLGYAEIIKDLSRRRKLLDIATEIQEVSVLGSGLTSSEALMVTEESIIALSQTETLNQPQSAGDLFDEAMQHIEEVSQTPEGSTPGIPSGLTILDDMTGGWLPGQIIVLAARPSVGKTALAMDFARAGAYLGGKSVLFICMEMSHQELMQRLLASEARVLLNNIKKGQLTADDRVNLEAAKHRIKGNNLFLDAPTQSITISHIRSRAIRQKFSPAGLDLLIIDYLSLIDLGKGHKNDSHENRLAALSRSLKLLAKELDIPIVVLAQLNRNSESRTDRKPELSDLRGSGSIEQDADIAVLIHRPDQSDPNIRPGEADLIIAKNRNGPTGKVPLVPMLEYGKYVQGDGLIKRDMSVYDEPDTIANAADGQVVYPPPTEDDDMPW
jgi:replicative DNA helicase